MSRDHSEDADPRRIKVGKKLVSTFEKYLHGMDLLMAGRIAALSC